jgi:hypothetical protein
LSPQDERPLKRPALILQRVQEPNATILVIGGSISSIEVADVCTRIRLLLENDDNRPLVCDVGRIAGPGAAAVDLLARLKLMTKRLGRPLVLQRTPRRLQELLAIAGLDEILNGCGSLSLEMGRQPEQREHAGCVEEEHDPHDLPT